MKRLATQNFPEVGLVFIYLFIRHIHYYRQNVQLKTDTIRMARSYMATLRGGSKGYNYAMFPETTVSWMLIMLPSVRQLNSKCSAM